MPRAWWRRRRNNARSEEPQAWGILTICLGVALDPDLVVSLRHGAYEDGARWHDFYSEWPALDEDFVLTEGQRYAWYTLDDALALPDLAEYARADLQLFRDRR